MPVHQVEVLDEAFLVALGIHRIAVPVPFIEAGGPANIYAIENEDRTFTLFDTGINTTEGKAALRIGLSLAGVEVKNISRIIISHGHIDHYGNAEMLSEESGAPIFVHQADVEKLCGHGLWSSMLKEYWPAMLTLGVPEVTLQLMYETTKVSRTEPPQVTRTRVHTIAHEAPLHFRHFDAEVLHLPGHTPGLICLYAPKEQIFFADDHVLARVSPNPLLDFSQGSGEGKFRALSRYLEGAKFVQGLDLKCVLPGHGPAFRGHRELLEGLFTFYKGRQQKLIARLKSAPGNVYELVPTVFPNPPQNRLFLMISEVLGNVEVLEDAHAILRTRVNGIDVFSVVN